jgi:uncharacterized RDD family membrane protein YckC
MKCPKCSYLGFETGDRCKNCGYDFSLMTAPVPPVDADLTMRAPESSQAAPDLWFDRVDTETSDAGLRSVAADPKGAATVTAVATTTPPAPPRDLSFPLFSAREEDDEPLIKLPAAPRPPLAVRRTPDQPRLRPRLDLEGARLSLDVHEPVVTALDEFAPTIMREMPSEAAVSGLGRRAAAGLIDLAILFGIDFLVIYSTLRMSGLTVGDWASLPAVPMIAFLGLVKLSYFGAFTAACGQTIGKMAMHIRVVADDVPLDPARAARRTLVSAVSLLAAGAGFIPVLVDPDHRALHDRVAGTRVVELPSI